MEYIEIVKDIIENYVFTSYPKNFSNKLGEVGVGLRYLEDFFNTGIYKINNTSKTFHNKKIVDFIGKYNIDDFSLNYDDALKQKKPIILQMAMHLLDSTIDYIKLDFIDKLLKDENVLSRMKTGKMFLFLYYGWEADSFVNNDNYFKKGKYKSFYEMFEKILIEWNLPSNSIIILNSDLLGEVRKKDYNFSKYVNVIFENSQEIASFTESDGDLNPDYSIKDYLNNIKKSNTKKVLRINRTPLISRDIMLYFLYSSGYIKNSITEHSKFIEMDIIKFIETLQKLNYINERFISSPPHLKDFLKINYKLIKKIEKDIPLNIHEIDKSQIYSNMHIPYENYEKTIFSWASTTFPMRPNYIFLNQSTFNPMLYYHPILWHTGQYTIKYFEKYGYKSYSFLFNEKLIESSKNPEERLFYSIYEFDRIMQMDKKLLINTIEENKDILEHNRNILFECNSIERIIKKFHYIITNKPNDVTEEENKEIIQLKELSQNKKLI